jgi:hypothetical protein
MSVPPLIILAVFPFSTIIVSCWYRKTWYRSFLIFRIFMWLRIPPAVINENYALQLHYKIINQWSVAINRIIFIHIHDILVLLMCSWCVRAAFEPNKRRLFSCIKQILILRNLQYPNENAYFVGLGPPNLEDLHLNQFVFVCLLTESRACTNIEL